MCGIIGTASADRIADRRPLSAGRDAMRHRGPDNAGEWWSAEGHVGFGHRRLSIVDLSPAGHQPMQDATGALCIVFNGEIYNFQDLRAELVAAGFAFRSRSDTEVILAAYRKWGTECVSSLNGTFALAIYDSGRDTVFMARDRAGEKPLFYSIQNGTLTFSSELKGLLANPACSRRIDPAALDCYLAEGYVPGDLCILQGIKKLPPAHALLFDIKSGKSRTWRYWQAPAYGAQAGSGQTNEAALVDQLDGLLQNAVQRQLVADVPVCVLLSGGLDSSLVAAMASRVTPRIKTFTVRFPGHGKFDETAHARLVARHCDTEHMELDASESSVEVLPMLARQFDEPVIDSSMIPVYLVSRLIREHCTVALSGDGGDELFGGYRHYRNMLFMERHIRRIPGLLRKSLALLADKGLPLGLKGRNWLQGLASNEWWLSLLVSHFDRSSRRALMSGRPGWPLVAESSRKGRIPQGRDLVQRATRMDFGNYLAEDVLVKVDRASMLNSLEVRAPLLDYRMIEFAFGTVPSSQKVATAAGKILLKRLAARLLPAECDFRRKQGFAIPLASWLHSSPWRDYFRDVLFDPGQVLFEHRLIKVLLDGPRRGCYNSERLFGLVMFELWRREYKTAL